MENIVKKIQNTAFQNNLWLKGSKIIVGVSGGTDSSCLLDILAKLASKYHFELMVAHVNYGLRGKDSRKDEEFVRGLSRKYGLKSSFLKPSFREMTEENLRHIRYRFFERLRKENNFDFIAVAHNLDDQVETYLMHVIRGTGLAGLGAMKYKRNRIIRPLLGVSRKEILEYLKINKLKYRVDRTNKETKYLRNKVRHKLIPYLKKNFNPNIKSTIFKAAESVAEDYDFISDYSSGIYEKNKELQVRKILRFHPALQRRVLLLALLEKKKNLKNIEASHIRELIKMLKSTKGKIQKMSFLKLKIVKKGDKVSINDNKQHKQ